MSGEAPQPPDPLALPPVDDLTIDNFWERWGGSTGFSREGFVDLWQYAAVWYGNAPGHDFAHAREVLWVCMELADLCDNDERPVNRKLLVAEALMHDAAAQRSLKNSGFSTHEERAGSIFEGNAARLGLSPVEASIGKRDIMSGEPGRIPRRSHEIILRRGDLYNVSCDYEAVFRPRTDAFEREARITEGLEFSSEEFTAGSLNKLLLLTKPNLILCSADDQNWHRRVDANLRRWAEEIAAERSISLEACLEGLGVLALQRLINPVETVEA